MIEIRIHGRGGQGGVTLAKIIATSRFLQGDSVQAFGIYAAERSGAPLQAFCRVDRDPITNRNLIYEPDHVIVLDPTLVGPAIASGLKPGGWILINIADPPEKYAEDFPGYRIATIDATSIALKNKLGTKSVPIVNTALAGAFARLLDFRQEWVHEALKNLGFVGGNITAADEAYAQVRRHEEYERGIEVQKPVVPHNRIDGLLKGGGAELPRIKTGQWATQQPQRQQAIPPCNHVCPAGNDVQGFLHALAKEDPDEALAILLRTSPFPAVCGRVCPAPCMDECNRISLDGAVNVRELERYAADHGRVSLPRRVSRDESVAIVGSGPAGLSAAYHLARLGYQVHVFEAGNQLGGLLRTGIPTYRLPRDVLDHEIDRILKLGIKTHMGERVDRKKLVELCKQYDAVLAATGLQEMRSLQLGGDDETVVQGIDFLDRVNVDRNAFDVAGEEVVIVGGGNTAFDAARTVMRMGARKVRMIYRRTRAEMPAINEEIDEAIEEGVQIDYLTTPLNIRPSGNRHLLTCRPMELGEPDESGRRRPVEIQDLDFEIPCDRVILALGQSRDLAIFPEGTEVHDNGELIGLMEKPMFAIGDLSTNEGTVTAAIGNGRRAALHIHNLLTGEQLLPDPHTEDDVIRTELMKMHLFERQNPDEGRALDPKVRRHTFDEVHQGLSTAEEAKRCLSCGVCNECDRCITYCPDGVLKRVGHEFVFDYAYCKGCGVCSAECPRNVIFMSGL
jgi:2-oxoacid:acceptor oxidoreductase gamma subunit (pyruvate/2-ketoisovalerate family)